MTIGNPGRIGIQAMHVTCPSCGGPKTTGGYGNCISCQRQGERLASEEGRESSRVNSGGLKVPNARGF